MKIGCECGATIYVQTDYLPHMAHFIPDQDWFTVLDAIDDAIEQSGPSAAERKAACHQLRRLIGQVTRSAYQCTECGRLYVDDKQYKLCAFIPAGPDVPRELFRSRPSSEA
jgi:hypothetical protein